MVRRLGALLAISFTLVACVKRPPGAPPGWPKEAEWIVDGRTGERSTFAAMIDDLSKADVVFVGEDHDNHFHHELQRRILAALAERRAGVGLGMEMLQVDSQPQADRFNSGALDATGLAAAVEWPRTWGFPFSIYRPIFDTAREHKIPVVALNAQAELVRKVSRVGVDGLEPDEKKKLPELDLGNESYRSFVKEQFEMPGHKGMAPERFEKFFAAQVLWDETMASRTVEALGSHKPMMIMAGSGHLVQRMGIPSRVERRLPQVTTRVVLPLAAPPRSRPDFKRSAERKESDWVWVTPEEPSENATLPPVKAKKES